MTDVSNDYKGAHKRKQIINELVMLSQQYRRDATNNNIREYCRYSHGMTTLFLASF